MSEYIPRTYTPVFTDERLNQLAQDCGLTIDEADATITAAEIQYFALYVLSHYSQRNDSQENPVTRTVSGYNSF